MKIKSAKSFRLWYKTEVKYIERKDLNYNENFLGTYHNGNDTKTVKGFFEMYHGHKPDIAGYLPSILKIAEDGQAIYEFLQNAVDCGSTHFYIFYNEKYFLAINNGSPFDTKGLESILNIAQTTKHDPDKIGRFGIGFKLAHRLVGKNEGTDELVRHYKGPILFSWSKLKDLESLLNNERIEPINPQKGVNNGFFDAPYLLKILLTNFPSDPNETVKDINYKDKILFPKEELNELIGFLKDNFKNRSDTLKKTVLNQGSLFFIKLGEDKKKLLDKDYSELKNGIEYSMNTLKRLQKVYINNDDIGKIPLQLEEGIIKIGSNEFERISPEYKEFDIKFTIGYNIIMFGKNKSYEQIKFLKAKPNFYKYFPMGDEINGLGFIVHCDSFSNEANRRKLHEDDVNRNLFPVLAKHISQQLTLYKTSNRNKFLNIYASLLLSDIPDRQNNKWLRPIFYDELLNSLQNNVPTKYGYSDNAQNVKIKKLKTSLNLSDFGLDHILWFEWDNEADRLLIDEATKKEKLGIEEWDIRDVVENSNVENINNYFSTCDEKCYKEFLKELESSQLRINTKNKICTLRIFKFTNGQFYSLDELVNLNTYGKPIYRYRNCLFSSAKTEAIKNELTKLGLVVSEFLVEDYPNIFSSVILPDDKIHYDLIAKWCIENANKLTAEEKKYVFLNFIDDTTKFDHVAESTLKDLYLFCNRNSEIKPLKFLIDHEYNAPNWLNNYKIKSDDFFEDLKPYLISDQEDLYKEIYLPNQDNILPNITEANEIKSLIKLYQDNQKSFFNNLIITKYKNHFQLIPKSNKTHQIRPSNKETRLFIAEHLYDTLFPLPFEFNEKCKNEISIFKGEELYHLILESIDDVDDYKYQLVDIVGYDEPKRKLIQRITVINLVAGHEYTQETFEYKIMHLACNKLSKEDYQSFRDKIVVEAGEQNFNCSDIPPVADKLQIDNREFSLSKILPSTYHNSNLLNGIISQFSKQGISSERLNALFGVNENIVIDDIFKTFLEQTEKLENPEQFFFLIQYHKHNTNADLSLLKFDFNCAVYPSKYALEKEKLADYLMDWIESDKVKLSELEKIGIWTNNSVIVELRKFLNGEINEFQNNRLAQETRFNGNQTALINSFEWLKEQAITMVKPEQFRTFVKAVDVINENRTNNGDLVIEREFDFKLLDKNTTKWEEVADYKIYLYDGEMPKYVGLNVIEDYIFYKYKKGDYAVKGNSIYINSKIDNKNILQKIAADDDNGFTFENLWSLFGEQSDETERLKQEIAKLKKQVAKTDNVTLGTDFSNNLVKKDQIEALRIAKAIVKNKLENEKFYFKNGTGEFSTIDGVIKDGIEYPLVVKSYIYQEEPLKIGANEWIQLIKANSMLWVHFGNGHLGCLKINEILRSQDKLTISFDTSNLENEDKINQFSKILRYFKNIHFDFDTIQPSDYSVAEDLKDYRFNERSTEEDLSADDESIL